MTPLLIVTKRGDRFECVKKGDCGMAIVGDGISVLEAVGSWCIYSGRVQVVCQPAEVLEQFGVQEAMGHYPAPHR